MDWMIQVSIPGRSTRFFSSPKHPDQPWVPCNLYTIHIRDSFLRDRVAGLWG